MTALVVVESMFGNTRAVADSIAAGLEVVGRVEVTDVAGAPQSLPPDITLLVIGGPTHVFGMSRRSTRLEAVDQGAKARADVGIRDWIEALGSIPGNLAVATFDTKVKRRGPTGSAAKAAARQLRHHGARIAVKPMSFYVTGSAGPLARGERERATSWGRQLSQTWRLPGQLAEPA